MPKIIVKSRYLTNRTHMANYLRYIATREGVELLPDAVKSRSATNAQRLFIQEHKKEMEGLHEYNYYLSCPTIENTSRAITAYAQSEYGGQQEYEQFAHGADNAMVSNEGKGKPATQKQKDWIEAHVGGLRDLLEYEDYVKNPTVGNASELIAAIAEYNTTDSEIYLKYIAERPGVDKAAGEAHGLWNMTGKADLNSELEKVIQAKSVAWVHIISLQRDEARRLNYESADVWRKIVSANAGRISKLYSIDMKNLNILGAFHNEGHHPHVHLFVYSNDKNEGVIPKKQMETAGERMRSMFTNSIFSEDMELAISRRNELRSEMSERVKAVSSFYRKEYKPDPDITVSLAALSDELPKDGKLQYAYLKPEVKEKVNDTLRRIIGVDEKLNALVTEYFALQHKLIEQYNDDPEKIEARYIDFVQHFYEPRTGKYAETRDMTALHNIILQCAAAVKNDARTRVYVQAGNSVSLVSGNNGMEAKPEVLPVESTGNAAGSIEVEKQSTSADEPEVLPVRGAQFQLYDAAGNLLQQEKTGTNGRAVFQSLPEGTYTVEDKQAAEQSAQRDDFKIKYAAVLATRLIASEIAALCETVESCSLPQKPEKTRQHKRFKRHNKNYGIREDVSR